MIDAVGDLVERIIARALPVRDRDAVLGDLVEESASGSHGRGRVRKLWTMIGIVSRYHAEPYREPDQRLGTVLVALLGLALLWVIPLASSGMFVHPELLNKPLVRIAALLWGASHLTSAIAVGLVVGRSTLLPDSCVPTRFHLTLLLGVAAYIAAPGFGAGLLAALCLVGSVLAGDMARRPELTESQSR